MSNRKYEVDVQLGSEKERLAKTAKFEAVSGDTRYLKPKEDPIAPDGVVDKLIQENPIYREAHQRLMLSSQRKQVAYGFDKYVETLNVNSWDTIETLDHIIDESIDKLHYLIMLKMKIQMKLERGSDDK